MVKLEKQQAQKPKFENYNLCFSIADLEYHYKFDNPFG